jgi:hypothetical protein
MTNLARDGLRTHHLISDRAHLGRELIELLLSVRLGACQLGGSSQPGGDPESGKRGIMFAPSARDAASAFLVMVP